MRHLLFSSVKKFQQNIWIRVKWVKRVKVTQLFKKSDHFGNDKIIVLMFNALCIKISKKEVKCLEATNRTCFNTCQIYNHFDLDSF